MNFDFNFFKPLLISALCLCLQMPSCALAKDSDIIANIVAGEVAEGAEANIDTSIASALPEPISAQRAADLYLEALKAMNEKRHADAKALLEKLIQDQPQHAGALLDLAIMQCSLGNKVEAERLFSFLIERFAPPQSILDIVEIHRKTGCVLAAPDARVSFIIDKGYDSNANQGASNSIFTIDDFGTPVNLTLLPEYLPKPDHYLSASLDLSRDVGRYNGNMFLQLRARQYDTLNNLNSVGLAAGIENQFKLKDWTVQPTVSVNAMTLENRLYQKQMALRLKLTAPDKPDDWMKYSLVGASSRVIYPTISNYDGNTFELRGIASKLSDHYFLNMSAAIMRDIGNDKRLGGNRRGWSFSGFLRSTLPVKIFDKPLIAELGWQRANWQSQKIYLPGLIDVKKHQVNSILRTSLGLPIFDHSIIQIEYRRILNRENISFLSFESNQIQLSWQWQR